MSGQRQKPGKGKRGGKRAKHAAGRKVGGGTRDTTREERGERGDREHALIELLSHLRRRDERVHRALVVLLSSGASTEVFRAIGTLITYAVRQAERRGEGREVDRQRVSKVRASGTTGGAS